MTTPRRSAETIGARGFHIFNPQDLHAMSINEMTDMLTLAYLLECHQIHDQYPSLVSFNGQCTIIWANMPGFDWFAESIGDAGWRIWIRNEIGGPDARA
jgi:hypothetical protein